jgi:putative transposase
MMKELRLYYPLEVMSTLFDVSRSGYYSWLKGKPSKRAEEDPRLVAEIKAAHQRNRETFGAERLQEDLADHGVSVGVHRIKRIKREHGIRCKQKRRYKATTNSKHNLPVVANHLDQTFTASAPNKVWVSDITYIPTGEGWLFLPVIRTSSRGKSLAMPWVRE